MLQYQSGEYSICIWDSDQTCLAKVLGDLSKYAMDSGAITVSVATFDRGTDTQKATKILEEAAEVRSALQYEGRESKQVLYEICDTITACINLARSLGYSQDNIQAEIDIVEHNNKERGRYDD